ncbi:MAG: CPBP family intramembrane metalloprotease [Deltaproteobacteria bacterium]|nr:CPBP family intramembrane metalloprotease [Deltaproteobacteria bacterium]
MFEDPAYPSSPPPPPDESIRPLSLFGAVLWVFGIELGFWWGLLLVGSLREAADRDLISRLCCQVFVYTLGLFLLLRVHGPHSPIRDFVAARKTHLAFYPLALGLGGAVAVPAAWLLGFIERHWPPEQQADEFVRLFQLASRPEQIGIAFGVVVVGPLLEEIVFRGALYRPLRQTSAAWSTVLVTAALFAVVHIDPRRMVPIFFVGLALGYLRAVSGSLIPPALLHMGFNAIPFLDLFGSGQAPPAGGEAPEEIGATLLVGSVAACVVGLALVQVVASRSRRALVARRRD